jgi:hypothetical protein
MLVKSSYKKPTQVEKLVKTNGMASKGLAGNRWAQSQAVRMLGQALCPAAHPSHYWFLGGPQSWNS